MSSNSQNIILKCQSRWLWVNCINKNANLIGKQVSPAIGLVITNRLSKKKWRSGWNLDELNKCSLAGGNRKQEK